MSVLVLLLEEPSAQALLEGLLPRLLPDGVEVVYLVFEGKQDLENNLARKLRGWRRADSFFAVLRDQDAAPCVAVKERLADIAEASGKRALVRVACRELEAWVAGDLEALARAFDAAGVAKERNKARFRNPDALVRPVEHIQELIRDYQKIDGARRMGLLLDPDNNASPSFRAFCAGVKRLVAPAAEERA